MQAVEIHGVVRALRPALQRTVWWVVYFWGPRMRMNGYCKHFLSAGDGLAAVLSCSKTQYTFLGSVLAKRGIHNLCHELYIPKKKKKNDDSIRATNPFSHPLAMSFITADG